MVVCKQNRAYEMRSSDRSSDVCSADLRERERQDRRAHEQHGEAQDGARAVAVEDGADQRRGDGAEDATERDGGGDRGARPAARRSEARSVGNERVRTCSTGWAPNHLQLNPELTPS